MAKIAHHELAVGIAGGIALREQSVSPIAMPGTDLWEASKHLGRACLEAMEASSLKNLRPNTQGVKEKLGEIASLQSKSLRSEALQRRINLFKIETDLIESSYLMRKPMQIRLTYQDELSNQIGAVVNQIYDPSLRKHHGALLGELTELTTAGLINYELNRNSIATLAPPHHDTNVSNKKHNNYDVLFVNRKKGAQAIQTKLPCLGFCEQPQTRDNRDARNLYSNEIALISGHCDLGIKRIDSQQYDLSTAELVARYNKAPETISSVEQEKLDEISELLVGTIINEGSTVRAGRIEK